MPNYGKRSDEPRWARLVVVLGLMAASVGAWLILRDDGQEGLPVSPGMHVLSMREIFPLAMEAAREWREDAVLNWADMSFQPTGESSPLIGSFAFRSPSNPRVWLLVRAEETVEGVRLQRDQGEFEVEAPKPVGEPIDPLQLPFDSTHALDIIMANGGDEFVAQHSEVLWPLTLRLRYRDFYYSTGGLVWVGMFGEPSSWESADVMIDAVTGEPERR